VHVKSVSDVIFPVLLPQELTLISFPFLSNSSPPVPPSLSPPPSPCFCLSLSMCASRSTGRERFVAARLPIDRSMFTLPTAKTATLPQLLFTKRQVWRARCGRGRACPGERRHDSAGKIGVPRHAGWCCQTPPGRSRWGRSSAVVLATPGQTAASAS